MVWRDGDHFIDKARHRDRVTGTDAFGSVRQFKIVNLKSAIAICGLSTVDYSYETGHGGTTGRFEMYKETAQEYAFLIDRLDSISQSESRKWVLWTIDSLSKVKSPA